MRPTRHSAPCPASTGAGNPSLPPQRRGFLARLARDERGSYLAVTGMLMPALVGVIGLGTEGAAWFLTHRAMQDATDSAAVSAATAYYVQGNTTGLTLQTQAVAAGYGFVNGTNGVSVTVNQPPASGTHTTTPKAVEVIISRSQNRQFSAMWASGPVTISARSVAVGKGGKGCVLSLDPTAASATAVQ